MSRISRLVVLVTALTSLFGVSTSTAGAVTWTNDGVTAFTATGGVGTLTATGVTFFACVGADASGSAPASATTATYSISGTISYTGCFVAGTVSTIDCGYTLTATTVAQPLVSGSLDLTCGVYFSGTKLCHIGGNVPATYTNEVGTLHVSTAPNTLRVTGANCVSGSNDLAHLTALDFQISSAGRPTVTRAA